MSVDLPAPFSPQIAWISPARTCSVTSSSALTPGKVLVIERISSSGLLIAGSSRPGWSPVLRRPGSAGLTGFDLFGRVVAGLHQHGSMFSAVTISDSSRKDGTTFTPLS
jgi:hypothetical protein